MSTSSGEASKEESKDSNEVSKDKEEYDTDEEEEESKDDDEGSNDDDEEESDYDEYEYETEEEESSVDAKDEKKAAEASAPAKVDKKAAEPAVAARASAAPAPAPAAADSSLRRKKQNKTTRCSCCWLLLFNQSIFRHVLHLCRKQRHWRKRLVHLGVSRQQLCAAERQRHALERRQRQRRRNHGALVEHHSRKSCACNQRVFALVAQRFKRLEHVVLLHLTHAGLGGSLITQLSDRKMKRRKVAIDVAVRLGGHVGAQIRVLVNATLENLRRLRALLQSATASAHAHIDTKCLTRLGREGSVSEQRA